MGRIIGLIGGTCLIIAALRLTGLQHDDQTLLGSVEVADAQQRLTPRQMYRQGKEMYLRGRIDQALPLLESATASTTGLSAVDRRDAEEYLSRTRLKLAQRALSADIRGQSPDQDPFAAPPAKKTSAALPVVDATRARVDRWMSLAQDSLRKGDKQDALKFAQKANEIAVAAKLKFGPGELSPAAFIAQVQNKDKSNTASAKPATPKTEPVAKTPAKPTTGTLPDWASETNTITTAAAQEEVPSVIAAGHEIPEAKPAAPTAKDQCQSLLKSAREDIVAGRYDDARRKAIQAQELDVTYDLFDIRPSHVLNEIDRLTGGVTIAKPQTPAPEAPATTANHGDAQKQQALRLIQAAKDDLANGNLEGAKEKALKAQELPVAYKLFEPRPELVLNEIAAQMASSNIAQAAPTKTEPAAPITPEAKPASAENSAAAKQLLAQARKALEVFQFEEARKLALEADKLKAAYGLFDDRPELVLADVDRIAAKEPAGGKSKPAADVAQAAPKSAPTAAAKTEADPFASEIAKNDAPKSKPPFAERQHALQLLKEAREHLEAGQLNEARAKAQAAEQLNVAFGVLDDRPDLILADIEAARKGRSTASVTAAEEPSNAVIETADAKFEGPAKSVRQFAPAAAQSQSITEFAPTGASALQLYNQGMNLLGRGDRAGAHRAFLAAHQSGQRLDPVREQRLHNYLRELAPKNGGKIQLAANQVNDTDLNSTGPALATEQSLLDETGREQSAKFDRLRTETLNAVFRAERLRAKNPEQALAVIDQAMASVEGADLPPESSVALLKSLEKTRSSLQAEITRQQPNLEQAKHNEEVLQTLKTSTEHKIRVEQELAKLVEEYNGLYDQRRFAEAEVVAKKAMELDPKNPVVVSMFWKARFGGRNDSNEKLRLNKEESFWKQLDDVEQAVVVDVDDKHPINFPDAHDWKDLTNRRKKFHGDNRKRSDEELRIQQSLEKRISLHEDNAPLKEVLDKIAAVGEINIHFDALGLEDEGVTQSTPVSINVDGIKIKSALNLMLESHHLAYTIQDDVLKITSRMRQQGDLVVATYPVADLVVPIPAVMHSNANPFGSVATPAGVVASGSGQMSVPPGGQAFAQDPLNPLGAMGGGINPAAAPATTNRLGGPTATPNFSELVGLITTTIAPDSWQEIGGSGTIREHGTTLSLVVRQTQRVHEEIADLLDQLRRLQDLQVTIEMRFVTVSDRFFERIGVDFNFNLQPTISGPDVDNNNLPLLPFGSVVVPQAGQLGSVNQNGGLGGGQIGGQIGGQLGQQGQQAQAGVAGNAAGFFTPPPIQELTNRSRYPNRTVVGMSAPQQFSSSLDVPFQQGSFEIGVPQFGGFQPNAGLQFGMAVLNDMEAFFFVQAAQGDQRANLMFAPKVTLYNGQTASVFDQVQRPFVVSVVPTVGFFSTGFQPVIQVIPSGIGMQVTAVISADRRFVRLSITPTFSNIVDVFTFTPAGGTGAGANGGIGGGGNIGGQGQQAFGGGFGGGGFGGGGGVGGGQFGIGGGMGTTQMVMNSFFNQIGGGFGGGAGGFGGQQGGFGGQQGNNGNGVGGGGTTITVQQPVVEVISVLTTVSVPDGGTVLLGGIKRLREGRSMAGVPILNKIPYVSRLFKNTGVGRETESVMLMVTPRIIIHEEEEELLGIPPGQ